MLPPHNCGKSAGDTESKYNLKIGFGFAVDASPHCDQVSPLGFEYEVVCELRLAINVAAFRVEALISLMR
jgi:hypothetical protein